MLTIWGRKTSINVQKALWAAAELGLAFDNPQVGGPHGKTDTEEYGRLNPNRLVPVLDDGGFILWESSAIVRYLVNAYGKGTLAPIDPKQLAIADQWTDWSMTTVYPELIPGIFAQLIRVPAKDRNPADLAAKAKRSGERLGMLDAHLAGRTYICGSAFTFADIVVGSLMYRYFTMPIDRPSLPNVEAWAKRLEGRKPYRDHVMLEWESMKVPGA
jgi:glutathione S-transferase